MRKKECIAMLLAGGQGSRLGVLTKQLAKPALPFGGKYRIIDFTLSNCFNSGIDTVGVLTQYQPLVLNSYIGIGSPWDLDRKNGGVVLLPPFVREKGGEWYKGTANAVYQNINFVDLYQPDYVLVLSGDHIYKMDYSLMLEYHKEKAADATIAVIEVAPAEASRFGILSTMPDGRIVEFEEKPRQPKSNLASMGIYIFNWPLLKLYLAADEQDCHSSNDFGKNIIPKMLKSGQRMYAYPFKGYWKDVGTVESLWQANMDLLNSPPQLDLHDPKWPIYSACPALPPQYISPKAEVINSIVSEGCMVAGKVRHSVLFNGAYVGEGAEVVESVILPDAKIGAQAKVYRAIVCEGATVASYSRVGINARRKRKINSGITLVGENEVIIAGAVLSTGM